MIIFCHERSKFFQPFDSTVDICTVYLINKCIYYIHYAGTTCGTWSLPGWTHCGTTSSSALSCSITATIIFIPMLIIVRDFHYIVSILNKLRCFLLYKKYKLSIGAKSSINEEEARQKNRQKYDKQIIMSDRKTDNPSYKRKLMRF